MLHMLLYLYTHVSSVSYVLDECCKCSSRYFKVYRSVARHGCRLSLLLGAHMWVNPRGFPVWGAGCENYKPKLCLVAHLIFYRWSGSAILSRCATCLMSGPVLAALPDEFIVHYLALSAVGYISFPLSCPFSFLYSRCWWSQLQLRTQIFRCLSFHPSIFLYEP
jgi:hypothetical protein